MGKRAPIRIEYNIVTNCLNIQQNERDLSKHNSAITYQNRPCVCNILFL